MFTTAITMFFANYFSLIIVLP